ncbi:Si-specific NAD(P)(+) transhydrogenase [Gammaproteobacteria bacterium]|nr:Si-specific NAD(P)(+) transhydrogenase [Gammaproteobacteria bacterium]
MSKKSSKEPAYQYDSIVIGSGPGGEGAAMALAKAGHRVATVERHSEVGGGCTHWGTIPSKALRHAAHQALDFRFHTIYRKHVGPVDVSYPELLGTAGSVINKQTNMRAAFYHRNRVDLLRGTGCIIDEHTVRVEDERHEMLTLTAKYIVIASGSRPYRPSDIDFSHPCIRDADTILKSDINPRSIIVYGAGVIGSEYASIFANFGVRVSLINTRDRLMSFLDDEITDALGYHLREQGVIIRHNEEYEKVEATSEGAVLHMKSGKRERADVLLWANGRSGNTDGLGLENIGLKPNSRGNIDVSDTYQTPIENIYAVGDVVGAPGLASASYDQGRFCASHILGQRVDSLITNIPTGIYTSPEISSIGKAEAELTEAKVPYEVGRSFFRSIARAQITGNTVGMLKVLFHTETKEILGIHCFGYQAAEIVHIGQAIMAQPAPNNSIEYFTQTTFNYPTMAEAYRVAALNGLNRLF